MNGRSWLGIGRIMLCCIAFISMFSLSAQTSRKENGAEGPIPIRVGDKVPEEFWTREYDILENGELKRHNLLKFKGKPLILDFWATWCGVCLQNFPKLDLFKEKFGNDINFLLVNSDSKDLVLEKVSRIFDPDKNGKRLTSTPSIIFDEYLIQLFPHRAIPHYIWIDNTYRVRAISTFDFVTENYIQSMVNRGKGIYR